MKKIPLTRGKYALVDDEDYDFLMQWKWNASGHNYAIRSNYLGKINGKYKKKSVWMHRVVNKTPAGLYTDHINRNKLDNRKENLRTVTIRQNSSNCTRRNTKGRTSRYKGVSWNKNRNTWEANIMFKRKQIKLGDFSLEREAFKAYCAASKKYHGEFGSVV